MSKRGLNKSQGPEETPEPIEVDEKDAAYVSSDEAISYEFKPRSLTTIEAFEIHMLLVFRLLGIPANKGALSQLVLPQNYYDMLSEGGQRHFQPVQRPQE